ncbi:helix-turn-helix domain-containing protein [Metabacillus iocasae]|uniref:Transposase n=1 Tax=Priestia iocasae TaxID=2291674 RepID=A0ABS2QU75_9BACI|nr:helix-turn-helix domain-containing protein [Metabacillus iocasae]MBM7702965.1 transposase [Metabacillus iocasae]
MLVKKAYKFRLYPNQKQMELIHKTIGCSRFVYNYFDSGAVYLLNRLNR